MAMTNVLKTWGVAALTFPFVLVTWVFCFGAYSFADVPIGSLMPPQMASHVTTSTASQADSALFWFEATANGISQVFLIGNPVTGIIFVLALAASSRWAAGLAVLSSILAVATAVAFGADATSVQNGLFGFSSVLTAIALGCTFYKPSLHVLAYTAVGVVSTVFAQAGLDAMVLPLGVVTLTAPFVFTTWVFLLAKTEL